MLNFVPKMELQVVIARQKVYDVAMAFPYSVKKSRKLSEIVAAIPEDTFPDVLSYMTEFCFGFGIITDPEAKTMLTIDKVVSVKEAAFLQSLFTMMSEGEFIRQVNCGGIKIDPKGKEDLQKLYRQELPYINRHLDLETVIGIVYYPTIIIGIDDKRRTLNIICDMIDIASDSENISYSHLVDAVKNHLGNTFYSVMSLPDLMCYYILAKVQL